VKRLRALVFLFLGMAAARASALDAIFQISPTYYSQGSVITVRLEVDTVVGATAVTPSVPALAGGSSVSLVLLSGPQPIAQDVPAPFREFTWTYSAVACGTVQLQGSASGTESGSQASAVTKTSQALTILCPGTPTPTPTVSPTATDTPWVIYGTPTPGAAAGNATALGNLFHPTLGQACVIQVDLPYPSVVRIDIYNRLGDRVRSFEVQGGPGQLKQPWDGKNDQGSFVGTGIYAAWVRAKGVTKSLKMVVIK
jgi:hypothetical protein